MAAILSIAAGFVAMVVFEGYIEEARRMMYTETADLRMHGHLHIEVSGRWSPEGREEPWNFNISEDGQKVIEDTLAATPEVTIWMKGLWINGMVTNDVSSTLFMGAGYDVGSSAQMRGDVWKWNTLYGVPLEQSHTSAVLVGKELGRKMGCIPNPPQVVVRTLKGYPARERPIQCANSTLQFSGITPAGQVSAVDLDVVGFIDGGYKELDARWVAMPLAQAQSLGNTRSVSFFSVKLKDPNAVLEVGERLKKQLRDKGLSVEVMPWQSHRLIGEVYRKVTSLLDVFRNFVIGVILCIATLSVLNTMIKIVKERTREIGTWRSLGYRRSDLMALFAMEGALLGLFGGGLGAGISAIFTFAVNAAGISYNGGLFAQPVPLSIAFVPANYIGSLVVLAFVCIGASLWATRGVLRKKISENLIYA
ncbi:MAG: FtsX-like permease family protein [Bdellovibrionaceae bacterium]|nr:FtsX-like permease family protein [Pseudobdellovibrionaceae bacterium]